VLLAIAAVAVGLSLATAAGSTAAPTTWTTEHYLTNETWHAFADVGSKGAGPDDIYAAQQDLKTPDGKPAGVINGYGINLHPPYVFFHWTATLPSGTLTLESAVNLKTKTAEYPIEGGTGRYTAARGTVTLTDDGSSGTLVTVRYER
jgi:hypothetical protein